MSLNVFQRLAGTLHDRFKIGRSGPTISQGTDNPGNTLAAGKDGDVFIRYGDTPGMFQMHQGVWREMTALSVQREVVTTAIFNASNLNYYLGVNRNGTVEIYLPPGIAEKSFIIKDEGGFCTNVKTITIFPAQGETIDSENSLVIEAPRSSVTIVYGSEWHII